MAATEYNVQQCIELLNELLNDSSKMLGLPEQQRIELLKAAGRISRPDAVMLKQFNREKKRTKKQEIRSREKEARAATGIRIARQEKVFTAPAMISDKNAQELPELQSPKNCYICKKEFTKLHFFYDTMCPECAEFNYARRFQTADLRGMTALVTGGRVKIGFQIVMMLLKAGADVIAVSRFPADAALRYSREKDYELWKNRLHIYGLDLRHTPSVEMFAAYIENSYPGLDILINNAAQTVRKPAGFYTHLMENEHKKLSELPEDAARLLKDYSVCRSRLEDKIRSGFSNEPNAVTAWNSRVPLGLYSPAELASAPYDFDQDLKTEEVFPPGQYDADLQQLDLRNTNSWRLKLGEIHTAEMLEVHLVNAVAPFVLCNRLIPVMKKTYTGCKHIVNVSAMEGKFLKFKKDERHPHTNMAKAALNMLTHSSSAELARHGIFMNAVDTGWVTDEDPAVLAARKQELHDFQPPLDIVDGAARVLDPVFNGINTGKHVSGKFLKDYFPIDW